MPGPEYTDDCVSLHNVMIKDRGGRRHVDELNDLAEVEYTRERSVISGARITVFGRACREQLDTLDKIAARRHEVAIFRGDLRAWEGPIVDVKWYSNRVVLICRDVAEYLNRTPLTKDWPNEDGGGSRFMTERVEQILNYELTTAYTMETNSGPVLVPRWEELDPPANVLPHLEVRPSLGAGGILTRSSTLAFEMMVGEHLQNLVEGGLDYATIGRKLLVWDSAQQLGRTRILTEADFYGELEVVDAGSDFAAIGHVSAQREEPDPDDPDPDESAGVGNAGAPDPFYGVWTRLSTLASEEGGDAPEQTELNSQARRTIAGRNPVPKNIYLPDGAGIRLGGDLTINDLVPGVTIPVRATMNLRPVAQDMRLDKVTVKETSAGETIAVSLSPLGALEAIV